MRHRDRQIDVRCGQLSASVYHSQKFTNKTLSWSSHKICQQFKDCFTLVLTCHINQLASMHRSAFKKHNKNSNHFVLTSLYFSIQTKGMQMTLLRSTSWLLPFTFPYLTRIILKPNLKINTEDAVNRCGYTVLQEVVTSQTQPHSCLQTLLIQGKKILRMVKDR